MIHIASKRWTDIQSCKMSFFLQLRKICHIQRAPMFERISLGHGLSFVFFFSCSWWIIKQFCVHVRDFEENVRLMRFELDCSGHDFASDLPPSLFSLLHCIWNRIHSPTLWSNLKGLDIDVCVFVCVCLRTCGGLHTHIQLCSPCNTWLPCCYNMQFMFTMVLCVLSVIQVFLPFHLYYILACIVPCSHVRLWTTLFF